MRAKLLVLIKVANVIIKALLIPVAISLVVIFWMAAALLESS